MREVVDGVRMHAVPPTLPTLGALRDVVPVPSYRYLAAVASVDADVYVQRGGAVLTGDIALACRLTDRLFVFMAAHDWDCTKQHLRGRQRLAGRYYGSGLAAADLVVAQSDGQRDLLEEHWERTSEVLPTLYPPATPAAHVRRHVLWIGRCVGWKRPLAYLDLAKALPSASFVMVSPPYAGADDLHRRVRERATALANVTFHEFVPFAATEALFERALAVVNTSTTEGFPNTFVQAARCGTPVASLAVDPDDVIRTHGLGVIADDDPEALRTGLETLLALDETWRRCSRNALRYFGERHDLTHVAPRFAGWLGTLGTTPGERTSRRWNRSRSRGAAL